MCAPSAHALYEKGVLDYLLSTGEVRLSALSERFSANEGYLNVALRVLASQGWLQYDRQSEDVIVLRLTDKSPLAFALVPLYGDVVGLMKFSGQFHPRKFEQAPFLMLEDIFHRYRQRYGMTEPATALEAEVQQQVLTHIEGMIIGPTVVALGMNGMFHKYFMEAHFQPGEFHADAESFARLLDMFVVLGWFEQKSGTYRFTEKGMFYARRASAYGVTVSYIPGLRQLPELLFGDPAIFWRQPKGAKEIHVDREMNVWGSGGAHSAYFKVVDEIIVELFNQPIERQPRGIVDMGCGNGAFLIHLYEVIEQRTLRGQLLEEHPLFLVGADYNAAALKVTRDNIIQADIWAKLIWGDIGRPDLLADDLYEKYGIQLANLLNVRTFLDHNRIWQEPDSTDPTSRSTSSGAFAYRGRRLRNALVEANLLEHFQRWAPYVERFGLLVIELHTIDPALAAQHLGRTAATAYDATHGYSDQYIVEIDVFHKVATEAGLLPVPDYFVRFPDADRATVSVNLLKKAPANTKT